MQNMIKTGHWYGDEHHCEAKYPCPYIPICYNRIELGEASPPEGFRCIFDESN